MFSELFLLEKIILFIKKLVLILNTCVCGVELITQKILHYTKEL